MFDRRYSYHDHVYNDSFIVFLSNIMDFSNYEYLLVLKILLIILQQSHREESICFTADVHFTTTYACSNATREVFKIAKIWIKNINMPVSIEKKNKLLKNLIGRTAPPVHCQRWYVMFICEFVFYCLRNITFSTENFVT